MPRKFNHSFDSKRMHREHKFFRWTCTGREKWQTWAIESSHIYCCPKGHLMRKGVEVHINEVLRDVFGNKSGLENE